MMPPAFFLLCRVAILGLFLFYVNFGIPFASSVKHLLVFWLELRSVYVEVYGHFDSVGSTYLGTGTLFPLSDASFDLLFQSTILFIMEAFYFVF